MLRAISPLNMTMRKNFVQRAAGDKQMPIIPGEASRADLGALVCDIIMLVIFLWNHIYYKMNMLFLIVVLVFVGIYISIFGIVPERYCFSANALEITHRFRKKICIPYEAVFNYDASARDTFVNLLQSNTVKVYYTAGTKKKLMVCRPRDAELFTELLRAKCPEFQPEPGKHTGVEVFINHQQNK